MTHSLKTLGLCLLSTIAGIRTLPAAGIPNTQQVAGSLISGIHAENQGRTAIIAYHNGILFTIPESPGSRSGSDLQVRSWDISDPALPVELNQWGVTAGPGSAHGYFKSGDYLILGPNGFNTTPWSFRANAPLGSGSITREAFPSLPSFLPIGVRGGLIYPYYVREYWTYNAIPSGVGGYSELRKGDPFTGPPSATWDHIGLTGVLGHPFVIGNILIYASDQSRTGVATYDISDLTNPVLLDVLNTNGPGGYWPELWGSGDGKLYVVFPYRTAGNGMRVVDITDPSNLEFVTDVPLPGDQAMYCKFQDEYAFIGSHKVDMRTFESVLDFHDDAANGNTDTSHIDISQFALPIGNLLVTGGVDAFQAGSQGMAIWAHQSEPDTRGPYVGYHIPTSAQTNYPVSASISFLIHETLETPSIINGTTFIVRPLGGSFISGILSFSFDNILTFTPDNDLLPNTTYEVILPDGGILDAAGNGMEGYSFTFSTGSDVGGNQPPEISSYTASAHPVEPGVTVTLTAVASDPEAGAIEYRFDLGDGSPKTAWSNTATIDTSYAEPGHYKTSVQVRDAAGSVSSDTLTVTVLNPLVEPQPTHSTPVLCDETTGYIWTVNPDNNTVTAVDASTLTVLFEVPVGADPRSIAQAGNNSIWVTCHDADRIDVLNHLDGSLIQSIPLDYGSAPKGVVISEDGTTAFVALYGSGELKRYDTVSLLETGSLALGPTPHALAMLGDGSRVFITRFISAKDYGEVWEVNAVAMTLTRTIRLEKFGGAPGFPGTPNQDGTASGRGVPNYLAGITITPDNQQAWIACNKANTERGTLFTPDLDQDNTVRNVLCYIDLTTGALLQNTMDIDNSISAKAVAYSPLGDYFFVALEGNDNLMILDGLVVNSTAGSGAVVTRVDVGAAPQGICMDVLTERIFVKNFMDRTLTVFDAASFYATGDSNMPVNTVSTVSNEVLEPSVLNGKRIFYNASDDRMSAEGYMTCATCHVDGTHDGRTWDFTGRGEGLRNTTSLRGRAGMAHGNVHWSGNFDEIQDFENDIRGGFGGDGFLEDSDFSNTSAPLGSPKTGLNSDLDDLAAYVASLTQTSLPRSPHRASDGSLTPEAELGRAVFQSMNCASCHSDASFTNSTVAPVTLMDVGTIRSTSGNRLGVNLTGIDVPTLHGIWHTAPYFHDGSAETLADVFTVAGGIVIPGENGVITAGASIRAGGSVLGDNDDTAHGRAFVNVDTGGSVTYNNVDGGAGGAGAIELRYSLSIPREVTLTVNGVDHVVVPPATGNNPLWRQTFWGSYRFENINLTAGATNTITISKASNWPPIGVDDVLISTADDLSQAASHRQVLSLPQTDQDHLIAYLMQLDGRPEDPSTPNATLNDWINANELNGEAALLTSDLDGDMLSLFAEFGFGLNPFELSQHPVSETAVMFDQMDNEYFTVTYRRNRNASALQFEVEVSEDLIQWNAPAIDGVTVFEEIIDADIDGDGSTELVRFHMLMDENDPRYFGRVNATDE